MRELCPDQHRVAVQAADAVTAAAYVRLSGFARQQAAEAAEACQAAIAEAGRVAALAMGAVPWE